VCCLTCLQLLPADPAGRAAARLIIQRFSDKAVPAFYRILVQQDQSVQAAAAVVMDTELEWLVDSMHPQGPFALGQQLGLVDCAIAPFLIRLFVLQHYRWATHT
jgi:glutathione S-transferase